MNILCNSIWLESGSWISFGAASLAGSPRVQHESHLHTGVSRWGPSGDGSTVEILSVSHDGWMRGRKLAGSVRHLRTSWKRRPSSTEAWWDNRGLHLPSVACLSSSADTQQRASSSRAGVSYALPFVFVKIKRFHVHCVLSAFYEWILIIWVNFLTGVSYCGVPFPMEARTVYRIFFFMVHYKESTFTSQRWRLMPITTALRDWDRRITASLGSTWATTE